MWLRYTATHAESPRMIYPALAGYYAGIIEWLIVYFSQDSVIEYVLDEIEKNQNKLWKKKSPTK